MDIIFITKRLLWLTPIIVAIVVGIVNISLDLSIKSSNTFIIDLLSVILLMCGIIGSGMYISKKKMGLFMISICLWAIITFITILYESNSNTQKIINLISAIFITIIWTWVVYEYIKFHISRRRITNMGTIG